MSLNWFMKIVKNAADIIKLPGADPGLLEKRVHMYKGVCVCEWGSLCWFYLILHKDPMKNEIIWDQIIIATLFLKSEGDIIIATVRLSGMLSPPKPSDEIQPNLVCEYMNVATDISHRVIMGKPCDHSSSFIFDWFFFILGSNEDIHKISNGFEIGQCPTKNLWVSCPWAFWKIPIDL